MATVSTPGVCSGREDFAHGLAAAAALVVPVAGDWLAVELDFELPHAAGIRPVSSTVASTSRRRVGLVDGLTKDNLSSAPGELNLVDQHI